MIDSLALGNLLAFSAQAAIIATVALVLPMLLRINSAGLRYAFWRAMLGVCLALPWLQARQVVPAEEILQPIATAGRSSEIGSSINSAASATLDPALIVIAIVVAGAVVRMLWLAIGYAKLQVLRGAGERAHDDEYRELHALLDVRADVRYVADCIQPMTFGWRRPVIVLPAGLREHAAPIREAVVAHELMHIHRRDWVWVVGEEIVRSVFWFHPALWWLISRVQLAREEVVDRMVVGATGRRRAYLEALIALSNATRVGHAPAFAWRRHLFRRIVLISQEDEMSARRVIVSACAAVIVAAVGAWYAMDAFPLRASNLPTPVQAAAGPLERAAQPISLDNPVPRRQVGEPIEVPRELSDAGATATVMVKLTVDQSGNVAEARVTWLNLHTPDPTSSTQAVVDAVVTAALDGVRRWRFDAPARAPIAFETHLTFGSGRYAVHRSPVIRRAAPPPPPPPPPPARATSPTLDGLRVGRDIPPPRKIRDVRPAYPTDAKDAGIQGVVIIEVRIDEQGRVDDARVLRSIAELDEAALDAVRQWEFQPTLMNGVPTPVIMVVTIQFSLV
jgi:TonB family protein